MRDCDSCGQQCAAGDHRVKCKTCDGSVHRQCRDITDRCYSCRYRQARANGLCGTMLPPQYAGERPFEDNMPTTADKGLPLPKRAGLRHPYGASANSLRIATHALYLGWQVEKWETEGADVVTVYKKGRGYLRLAMHSTGRMIRADTQRKRLTPNTARVLKYLEEK